MVYGLGVDEVQFASGRVRARSCRRISGADREAERVRESRAEAGRVVRVPIVSASAHRRAGDEAGIHAAPDARAEVD